MLYVKCLCVLSCNIRCYMLNVCVCCLVISDVIMLNVCVCCLVISDVICYMFVCVVLLYQMLYVKCLCVLSCNIRCYMLNVCVCVLSCYTRCYNVKCLCVLSRYIRCYMLNVCVCCLVISDVIMLNVCVFCLVISDVK